MYALVENNSFRGQGARTYNEKCPVLIMGGSGISVRKNLLWSSYNHGIMLQSDGLSYGKYQYVNHNFIYNNSVINSGKAGVFVVANTARCNPNRDIYDNTFANNILYNAHQHECWPDGTHCGWSAIAYLVGVATYTASPSYWYNNPSWGKNTFQNNLLSQFDPNTNRLNTVLCKTAHIYEEYDGAEIQAALPGVFKKNLFQVDPQFGQLGFAGVTLLATSPCIDAGLNMNPRDLVVRHLLATDDAAWARANGVDTLVWYGEAPDIGAYESDPAITMPAAKLALYPNYPNPFNPSTSISYYLPSKTRVTLEIYNASGALVRRLGAKDQQRGVHTIVWNGLDDRGGQVASGVYFCRLKAGRYSISRKMILIR